MPVAPDVLAHLNVDDIDRLHRLMMFIASGGKARRAGIPGVEIGTEDSLWPYIREVEEDLEARFIAPPDDYLEQSRGSVYHSIMNLVIPLWDEYGQSDYSLVVDIHLDRMPHLIEVEDIHVL